MDKAVTARQYRDLPEHIDALRDAGLLIKVDRPINKDTEMHPLVRWQYRGGVPESDRKAWLFTNVTDAKGKTDIRTVMRFHPRMAPIKAAIFPLLKKNVFLGRSMILDFQSSL